MVEWLGFWGAWAVGVILMVMSVLGVRGFLPRAFNGETRAIRMFGLALTLGFLAAGLNTLYWQVFTNLVLHYQLIELADLRRLGGFLDMGFKGLAAFAIYLHLAAWRESLPDAERRRWGVLAMAFYPNRTGFIAMVLNGFRHATPGKE